MSIFSDFVNSDVPKIDPLSLSLIGTMFNFVEIYRYKFHFDIVFRSKVIAKNLQGLTQSPLPLDGRGLIMDMNEYIAEPSESHPSLSIRFVSEILFVVEW